MAEQTEQIVKKSMYGTLAMLIVTGIIALSVWQYFKYSMDSTSKKTNLALTKDGKTYLYCNLGNNLVASSLERNESPVAQPFMEIFDFDGLFIEPYHITELTSILADSCKIHKFQEKSYDGYLTVDQGNHSYKFEMKAESTANIGEQVTRNTITLYNQKLKDSLQIIWNKFSKSNDCYPVKNCVLKEFNVAQHPAAGETVISGKDFVVVNVNTLLQFYGNKASVEFNEEQEILYIHK